MLYCCGVRTESRILRCVWQEHEIASADLATLCILLFLGIYNCEVNRADVLERIFQHTLKTNQAHSRGLTWHILGLVNSSLAPENIMRDLCLLLQNMSIPTYSVLCENVINYAKNDAVGKKYIGSDSVHGGRMCRLSLRAARTMCLKDETRQISLGDDHIPPDMPIQYALWAAKSSTEQQIILLIVCIQHTYIASKYEFVTLLFGPVLGTSIDQYTVKPHRILALATACMPILHKINNNVDSTNTDFVVLMHSFVEETFKGVFGNVHKTLMTLSFFAQIYVICYLETPMRLSFYQHVVSHFNRRLESNNKELTISTNIPPNLTANMDFWAKRNLFSTEQFRQIFASVCI